MSFSSSSSSDAAHSLTPFARVKEEPGTGSRVIVIREPGTGTDTGSSRLLTPKMEPGTDGGRSLKKAVVKEEAVRAALAASLNDVPPAPVDFALEWSTREHAREEEERRRRAEAEEKEVLERYERCRRRRAGRITLCWTTATRTAPAPAGAPPACRRRRRSPASAATAPGAVALLLL